MSAHTYSIEFDDSCAWGPTPTYTRTACTCGIASGMSHQTLESARFLEADHVCIGTRNTRPSWDGDVIDNEGRLVHITDLPMSDRAAR